VAGENRTYGWGEGMLMMPDEIDSISARKDCTKQSANSALYSIVKYIMKLASTICF